jgi:hypothetical protein
MLAPPLPRIRAISSARLPLEAKVLSAQISASVSSFRSSRFVFGDFAGSKVDGCNRLRSINPRQSQIFAHLAKRLVLEVVESRQRCVL